MFHFYSSLVPLSPYRSLSLQEYLLSLPYHQHSYAMLQLHLQSSSLNLGINTTSSIFEILIGAEVAVADSLLIAGCLLLVVDFAAVSFFGSVFLGLSLFSLACPPLFINEEMSSPDAPMIASRSFTWSFPPFSVPIWSNVPSL